MFPTGCAAGRCPSEGRATREGSTRSIPSGSSQRENPSRLDVVEPGLPLRSPCAIRLRMGVVTGETVGPPPVLAPMVALSGPATRSGSANAARTSAWRSGRCCPGVGSPPLPRSLIRRAGRDWHRNTPLVAWSAVKAWCPGHEQAGMIPYRPFGRSRPRFRLPRQAGSAHRPCVSASCDRQVGGMGFRDPGAGWSSAVGDPRDR